MSDIWRVYEDSEPSNQLVDLYDTEELALIVQKAGQARYLDWKVEKVSVQGLKKKPNLGLFGQPLPEGARNGE